MKLPKTLYVKIMKEDEEYFVADKTLDGIVLVDMGDKVTVGIYNLVETIKAEAVVKTETVSMEE